MTDTLIRPFAALRPATNRAQDVAAPPYDVLSTEEARAMAGGRPWSFLHISKPEIDLAPGTDPYGEEVYAKAAANMAAMVEAGVLVRDDKPCYYVYRLVMGDHIQTGIVAAGSVAAYEANRIRRHEHTTPVKEDDRVRQIEAVNAQTGPVFVTHRADQTVAAIVGRASAGAPNLQATLDNGVEHTLWVVDDDPEIENLTNAFEAMDAIYIADGHHRSAAASRVTAARRQANPDHTGDESYNSFLVVSFPDDEVLILDYNRVLKDLNGLSAADFLARIEGEFTVAEQDAPVRPDGAGRFGMYVDGRWYALTVKGDLPPESQPVARLDISLLGDRLLEPVLGISDPRTDKRIDFVGGARGLEELQRRVDSGDWAVAFALYPTSLADLMAVADAGEVMPPKSTWFEPKLADGIVSLVLD